MNRYYRQLRTNKNDVENSLKIGGILLNISSNLTKIGNNENNVSSNLNKIDENTSNLNKIDENKNNILSNLNQINDIKSILTLEIFKKHIVLKINHLNLTVI